jgi:hypothetical protein
MTTPQERQQADQDDADRFAHRSVMLTSQRAHIADLKAEIEQLRVFLDQTEDLVAQNDELRAALTRVEDLCSDGEDRRDWIAASKIRDALESLYAPTQPVPDLELPPRAPSPFTGTVASDARAWLNHQDQLNATDNRRAT